MDEHAYIIYANDLSITGMLFLLYQDLHIFMYGHTLKHTQSIQCYVEPSSVSKYIINVT